MSRPITLLTLLCLVLPAVAHSRDKREIPGGPLQATEDGLLTRAWGCGDSLADLRRKDEGVIVCLESITLNPSNGLSEVVVSVREYETGPDGYTLRLDSGRTERHLSDWQEAGVNDKGRTLIRFPYVTWDPAIPIEHVELKVKGKGVRGAARWVFDEPVAWEGSWGAEPEVVWDEAFAAAGESCRYWDVRRRHAEDVADELSDGGATTLPLQLRYLAVVSDDDSEHKLVFADHGLTIEFDEGKLVVKGREKFIRPLGDRWSTDEDRPNVIEVVYDGAWVTVRVNDRAFGPIAGRGKEGEEGRFRWEVELEDNKTRIRDLRVAPCAQPDADAWAPPEAEVVVAAAAVDGAPTSAPAVTAADGRQVLAVLRPGKRKKSALEVMQTAAGVAQGAQQVGSALGQVGSDMKHNVDAYERGDYESMRSTDTRIEIGEGGARVDHASAGIERDGDGATVDIEHTSGEVSWGGGGGGGREDTLETVRKAGFDPAQVAVIEVAPRARAVEVFVEGDRVGRLRRGDPPIVLVLTPGRWTITVGKDEQTVEAKAGGRAAM